MTGIRGDLFMTKLRNRKRKTDRNKEIVALKKAGVSWREIAQKYDLSICRVRQIYDVWEYRDE